MLYLTSDGRIVEDSRGRDGDGVTELDGYGANAALVTGARKTGIAELVNLIEPAPPDAKVCEKCRGSRMAEPVPGCGHEFPCEACGCLGWVKVHKMKDDRRLAERVIGEARPRLSEQDLRIVSVERTLFDASYLAFLDEQIELAPQGPKWTARLKARRSALSGWHDRVLLTVRALASEAEFSIKIDPENEEIVLCERYDGSERAG